MHASVPAHVVRCCASGLSVLLLQPHACAAAWVERAPPTLAARRPPPAAPPRPDTMWGALASGLTSHTSFSPSAYVCGCAPAFSRSPKRRITCWLSDPRQPSAGGASEGWGGVGRSHWAAAAGEAPSWRLLHWRPLHSTAAALAAAPAGAAAGASHGAFWQRGACLPANSVARAVSAMPREKDGLWVPSFAIPKSFVWRGTEGEEDRREEGRSPGAVAAGQRRRRQRRQQQQQQAAAACASAGGHAGAGGMAPPTQHAAARAAAPARRARRPPGRK